MGISGRGDSARKGSMQAMSDTATEMIQRTVPSTRILALLGDTAAM